MNQKKIGSFLRDLRKEKNLTQEQLAERFNITNRTVSIWESGNNMPDLSILVELADFYDVDIREIINGERKSEDVNQEEKEKMMLVAEYAEDEKKILLKRFGVVSIIRLCSMIVGIAMLTLIGYNSLPMIDFIMGAALGLAFTALVVAVLYSTGVLAKIMKKRNKPLNKTLTTLAEFIIAISVTIIFLIFLVESF